jgi:hypothetical protein
MLLVVGVAMVLVAVRSQRAEASARCTGNQIPHVAPYECDMTRTVDGSEFHAHIAVSGNGTAVTTISLAAPRSADTPVRVVWHQGIAGPASGEAFAVIAAGEVGPATLTVDRGDGCGGQLDVKAVFVGSGQASGRLAGPLVTISSESCTAPSSSVTPSSTAPATTAPTTATTPTTPATAPSTAITPTSAASTPRATVLAEQVRPAAAGTALPVTGRDTTFAMVAGGLALVLGSLLIGAERIGRRREMRKVL